MKVYAQFLAFDNSGNYTVPCGTDSYITLDGRKNLDGLYLEAAYHYRKHKAFKNWKGFEIVKSDKYTDDRSKVIYIFKDTK